VQKALEIAWAALNGIGGKRLVPFRPGTALFAQLPARYPGTFAAGQVRTFQRRVQAWRQSVLLAYDDHWLRADGLARPQAVGVLQALPLEAARLS
jgi:hypothetical protein